MNNKKKSKKTSISKSLVNSKIVEYKLPVGFVVKINGIPIELVNKTTVRGTINNLHLLEIED